MKRPAVIVLGGAALLIGVLLHDLLSPSTHRLPGIDSGNLYTWEIYTREALGSGRLPFWNPYQFAGTPHLADTQTTVLYPPALLLRWLPAPAFFGWMIALHLWIAAAGALFAARAIGLGWFASAAAAAAVMLGGSVPGWIHNGHLLVLYSAAWVPWAIGLAIVSVRSGRVFPDGRLVAVLAVQFLSGYLQGSLYLAAAVSLYFVFSAIWPAYAKKARRWTPLTQLVLVGLLCAAAVAFQLLPTATLVSQAGRSAGLPYEDAIDGSWRIGDLTTLFFPFHEVPGAPPHRYLPDHLAYVGLLLALFVPFAFLIRDRLRVAVYLGLLTLLAVALALGDALPAYRLHYAVFPGLRIPGRVLFLATVGLALLGAIGLEAFLMLAAGRKWIRLTAGATVAVGALALATYMALHPATPQRVSVPGWPWMPIVAATGVLAVAGAAFAGRARAALSLALAAVVLDVTTLNVGAVATTPLDSAADIRQAIGPPTGGRAISVCENRISARELLLNHEPTLDGPPGMHLRAYGEWASVVKSGDIPPADGMYRRIGSEGQVPVRGDLLDLANVSRVIACGDQGLEAQPSPTAWARAVWMCTAEEVSRREAIARLLQGRYAPTGVFRPRHSIKVRWAPGLDPVKRAALAARHHLEDEVWVEGDAWRYVLGDPSVEAVVAIIQDPDVLDTHGVDRGTGAIMSSSDILRSVPHLPGDDERQLFVGSGPCQKAGRVTVTTSDQMDGHVSVRVNAPADGFVFLSEPFYPDRHAYIDGQPVTSARAALAFTAVAVPAGEHTVELRYDPSRFYVGSAISGLTGAGYAGLAFVRRRRRTR